MAPSRADAIVVLGRGVDDDGALPLLAKQRVDRAAELFAWEVAPRIIFSGRCSLMAQVDPPRTEAAAMSEYARSLGLPKRALILEEESRDTVGNAYFVMRRFLEPNEWTAIRVVTSDFHIQRTAWVFQKILGLGYDVAFSPAPSELDHASIAARAREESDISTFLIDWMGGIPDGDPVGLARLIWQEHPGYAPEPSITRTAIAARIDEIARAHRSDAAGPRGHRTRQERISEL